MAEATKQEPGAAALGVAYLRGKLTAVRKFNGQKGGVMHVIALPAADEWALPGAVEVWASKTIGEVEQMVSVKVRISGIPRTWKSEREDPNTGEIRTVRQSGADNTLSVIE
jgi:hypothetical protein